MKTWTMWAAILALALSAGVATAEKMSKEKFLKGEITKIDGAIITLQPVAKENATVKPAAVEVTTNDATVVTVNGQKKAVSDLAVGQKAEITVDADTGKTALAIKVGERVKKPGEHPGDPSKPKH